MALMLMLVVSPRVLFCLRLNDIIGHGRSLSDCWDLDPEPPAAVRDLHQISPKKNPFLFLQAVSQIIIVSGSFFKIMSG